MDIWVILRLLLVGGIVIPAAVWACWRVLSWVIRGFFREVPNP